MKFGRDDMVKRCLKSRRTGFYCAVLREGEIGAGEGGPRSDVIQLPSYKETP
jgi:MOSC domain-containing protein YiiM